MEKKTYENPIFSITVWGQLDIICTSGAADTDFPFEIEEINL